MNILGVEIGFQLALLLSLFLAYFIQTLWDINSSFGDRKLTHFFVVWALCNIAFFFLWKLAFDIVPIDPENTLQNIVPITSNIPLPNSAFLWWFFLTGILGFLLYESNNDRFAQWNKMFNFFFIALFSFLAWKFYVVKILVTG